MPLSPEALRERYDRLNLRIERGTLERLRWLAKRAGKSPTKWLESVISAAFARESKKEHDKG